MLRESKGLRVKTNIKPGPINRRPNHNQTMLRNREDLRDIANPIKACVGRCERNFAQAAGKANKLKARACATAARRGFEDLQYVRLRAEAEGIWTGAVGLLKDCLKHCPLHTSVNLAKTAEDIIAKYFLEVC
jgi:hypothetical protein